MSQTHRKSITKEQWDEAAASYELGYRNGAQIARELGVSPATVSREFKRRGCVKASRIAEFVADLEARLDAEAEQKAQAKAAADAERAKALDHLVGELMDALMAADQAGNLSMANPEIARIDKALQLAMR
ncbi:helix-turn-helix domain-containing protein [Sphingomonas sp. RB56-2]|jgi:IS30 family transposase|uniref:Helix-turn-helix domain-containing protein n=1 Tax=Sphingomonas brevis TaxID=2908206 RepID=A0ABT0S8U9_9SPHN|nr:helix-turn-helix domain-containing protein [Sphingomonas brevis]MCL6740564.1 helix-turn-helix domain-containing protein [Sphingomonas brevis]